MENTPYGQTPAPGDYDFFGGAVEHAANTKEYASYSPPPSPAAPPAQRSNAVLWIVVSVVAVLVLGTGVLGYRMLSGATIVMPDRLLGMDRIDPESPLGAEIDRSWSSVESAAGGDIDFEVGAYSAAGEVVIVAATDSGGDAVEQDEFFAGLATGMGTQLPGVAFEEADAGPAGGRMQCLEVRSANAGACAWIAEETMGIVVMTGATGDAAATTIQVRDAVEQ